MKKFLSLVLCVALLCMLAVSASASTGNTRLLEYDHIDTVTANITMNRFWGIATCDGSITASGDYPVYVQVSLQRNTENGWETLQTWTNEGQYAVEASDSYAIPKGYQYRTYTAGIVYDENGTTIIDSGSAEYGINYY